MSKPEAEKNKTATIKVEAMGSCMIDQMREKQRDDPSSGCWLLPSLFMSLAQIACISTGWESASHGLSRCPWTFVLSSSRYMGPAYAVCPLFPIIDQCTVGIIYRSEAPSRLDGSLIESWTGLGCLISTLSLSSRGTDIDRPKSIETGLSMPRVSER